MSWRRPLVDYALTNIEMMDQITEAMTDVRMGDYTGAPHSVHICSRPTPGCSCRRDIPQFPLPFLLSQHFDLSLLHRSTRQRRSVTGPCPHQVGRQLQLSGHHFCSSRLIKSRQLLTGLLPRCRAVYPLTVLGFSLMALMLVEGQGSVFRAWRKLA